ELRRPVAFVEQAGEHAAQRREFVEETHSADANRPVSTGAEPGRQVGAVEHGGRVGRRLAAGGAQGERPRVPAGAGGGRRKPGETRGVGGEGEGAGGVPFLPAAGRQQGGQAGRAAGRVQAIGDVVAQRVERDE